jgi:fido (protein-threonine AMPylation protein)
MLERRPHLTLADYESAGRDIEIRHSVAWSMARAEPIRSFEDFRKLLVATHGITFGQSEPQIAGRFRQPGEDVYVGGPNPSNEFKGVEATQIADELQKLYNTLRPEEIPKERKDFSLWAARFLERFFRIHPFVDGNGRIARLMLRKWALEVSLSFSAELSSGEQKRKYVKALERAHKTQDPSHPHYDPSQRTNGLEPLRRWIDKQLEEMPPGWEDVGDPPAGL